MGRTWTNAANASGENKANGKPVTGGSMEGKPGLQHWMGERMVLGYQPQDACPEDSLQGWVQAHSLVSCIGQSSPSQRHPGQQPPACSLPLNTAPPERQYGASTNA